MKDGIGDQFQKETKYQPGKLAGGSLDRNPRPDTYKTYPGTSRLTLPPPETQGGVPLWDAIRERRSCRDFGQAPLSLPALSQLLWATQGITAKARGFEFRAAPSAGALYPVETYLAVLNVDGLEPGIYHYAVRRHELEPIWKGDCRADIAAALLDQHFIAGSTVVFLWTAVFQRSKWKYKQRAYRYVYLDAGQIAQNLALAAVALGLGSCQVGALYDDEVNSILGVDGEEESIVYTTAVGIPALVPE
jgi:SagB-type dehydrogenase family enzyme